MSRFYYPHMLVDLRSVTLDDTQAVGGAVGRVSVWISSGCQATSGIDPPATPKTDPPKKRRMLLKWKRSRRCISVATDRRLRWSRLFRQVEGFAKVYSGCVDMPSWSSNLR